MYAKGDIVLWSGHRPCIARVLCPCDMFENSFKLSAGLWHSSCHYSRLRPATDSEKTLLGESKVYWLEDIKN